MEQKAKAKLDDKYKGGMIQLDDDDKTTTTLIRR